MAPCYLIVTSLARIAVVEKLLVNIAVGALLMKISKVTTIPVRIAISAKMQAMLAVVITLVLNIRFPIYTSREDYCSNQTRRG